MRGMARGYAAGEHQRVPTRPGWLDERVTIIDIVIPQISRQLHLTQGQVQPFPGSFI